MGTSLLAGCSGPYSTLDPAGPSASAVAIIWWAMLAGFGAVLIAVVAIWLYATWRDPGTPDAEQTRRVELRWLIGGGLALPLASTALLLAFGLPMGHRMLPAGEPALVIEVTGRRFDWLVHYPDYGIDLTNRLHIPAGEPVDVHLTSLDVIHSFWVPRLGGKLDLIPGQTNVHRMQADEPGLYAGQCAEFCGSGHTHMKFTVEAHSPEAFAAWLEEHAADE